MSTVFSSQGFFLSLSSEWTKLTMLRGGSMILKTSKAERSHIFSSDNPLISSSPAGILWAHTVKEPASFWHCKCQYSSPLSMDSSPGRILAFHGLVLALGPWETHRSPCLAQDWWWSQDYLSCLCGLTTLLVLASLMALLMFVKVTTSKLKNMWNLVFFFTLSFCSSFSHFLTSPGITGKYAGSPS